MGSTEPAPGGTKANPGAQPGDSDALAKYAMLSVYYASIGDQFTVTGAPSVAVPPDVKPLALGEALAILSNDPVRLTQALWQLVRTTPIRQFGDQTSRYPDEIDDYLSPADQEKLDRTRVDYRSGASLVAACLRACHHNDRQLFDALQLAARAGDLQGNPGFTKVAELLFNETPEAFVTRLDERWHETRLQIDALEHEIDLNIASYVEMLAATAAYMSFIDDRDEWRNRTKRDPTTVFPVASVIKQDTKRLWTKATVTTLAEGDYDALLAATSPDNWHWGSDVIRRSTYTTNPMSPKQPGEPELDPAREGYLKGLLYEVAAMTWGQDKVQQGVFRNVLNVERTLDPIAGLSQPAINVKFSLCRSISSDVLWDRRKGGITVNEGFLGVVPLGHDRWRITSRKLLKFSDRTPYSGGSGLTDFGQMLNYLAPAALSWWVETETYSLGQRAAAMDGMATNIGSKDGT